MAAPRQRPAATRDWKSPQESAAYARVSVKTIRRRILDGSLPAHRMSDPVTGHLRFSPEEVEAVREATMAAAAAEYRAGPLVTSGTGFPLPIQLDPSVIITGAGALNPIRSLATVTTICAHDWQGVSTDAVVASYDQEGTEVSDDTPTLAGPKINTQRGSAFVPCLLRRCRTGHQCKVR